MYESFFGLTGKPFTLLPDADFLYMSKRHKRAINLLEYATMSQSGFMVISGEVGAGKTTAIRHYLKHLGPDVTVGLITNSSKSLGRLLGWIAMAFELDDNGGDDIKLYHRFVDFLLDQYGQGKRTVLIIDEAQNLTPEMLEDLRMLSNINNERDQILQIILVGQPELLHMLQRPDLRQFAQRIAVHCHLVPLTPGETAGYIRHRLAVVGGSPNIFNDTACAAVHFFTEGVPRLINLLCDQSLLYAFAEDQEKVTFQTVTEVVLDRSSTGLSSFRAVVKDQTEEELMVKLEMILKEIQDSGKEGKDP
jgi:type II secretory pathway predicted ATPase ExeA